MQRFVVFWILSFHLLFYFTEPLQSQDRLDFSEFHSCKFDADSQSCIIDQKIDAFFRDAIPSSYDDPRFIRLIDELTRTHPHNPHPFSTQEIAGNAVEMVDTAERSYEVWTELIEQAQDHIHIKMFFIEDDVFFNKAEPVPCPNAPELLQRSAIICKVWQAAERGVRVRLITDSVGNSENTVGGEKLVTALTQHPLIDVQNYNPILAYQGAREHLWQKHKVWLWAQNRLHSKLMIVDGRQAVTGGRNIGRNYMKPDPDDPGKDWGRRVYGLASDYKYRDTEVLLTGPGVHEFQRNFLRNWLEFAMWEETISTEARKWSLFNPKTWGRQARCVQQVYYGIPYYCKADDKRFEHIKDVNELSSDLEFFPDLAAVGSESLRFIDSLPARIGEISKNPFLKEDNKDSLTQAIAGILPIPSAPREFQGLSMGERVYIAYIRNAKSSIRLTNPYLALHEPIRNALLEAVYLRGVQLEIFTNSAQSNDPADLWDCSAQDFKSFLDQGVAIYEFMSTKGMLHAKTAIFDDEVVFVGSFNFDGISFDNNAEVIAILRGQDSVGQLSDIWQVDMQSPTSRQMNRDILWNTARDRGLNQRLTNAKCRNFGVVF